MTDDAVVIHQIRQVIDNIDDTVDPVSEPLSDRDSALLPHAAGQPAETISFRDTQETARDTLILTRDCTPAPVPPDGFPRIGCTLPEVFGQVRVGQRAPR